MSRVYAIACAFILGFALLSDSSGRGVPSNSLVSAHQHADIAAARPVGVHTFNTNSSYLPFVAAEALSHVAPIPSNTVARYDIAITACGRDSHFATAIPPPQA